MSYSIEKNISSASAGVQQSEATAVQKTPVSESDHAMYLGMMSMIESMGRSEELGASLAVMSTTVYDTMVTNGTNQVEKLRDTLEVLGEMLENWDDVSYFTKWDGYFTWEDKVADLKKQIDVLENDDTIIDVTNPLHEKYISLKSEFNVLSKTPPFEPKVDPSIFRENLFVKDQYTRKSGARAYVNSVSQQLSAENNDVISNKRIGDALQSQVQSLVTQQGMIAGEVTSVLRIIQRQLQYGSGHK